MATSKIVAPLCLMVLVFSLCSSMVRSQDVCAGVERPDPETIPCTINCILPDFVCGTDGVTYTCGCDDASAMALMSSRKGSARPRHLNLCPSNIHVRPMPTPAVF
ncbi:hypothetical protein OIU76_021052 [Salix suchowensis]|nr:hypothetical protein OIU76_021052 [Salix suchowensis]